MRITLMGKETCFKLNNEYRDVRLTTNEKLEEFKRLFALIEEYKCKHPESNLSELKLPHDFDNVKFFVSRFVEYDPKKRYAFIRGLNGKYLCSQNGDRPMSRIERPVPLGWEVFGIEELGDTGKIALKSCGKYVSSENGLHLMRCNRLTVGEWEQFELIQHGGAYLLKGNNGNLVSQSTENANLTCTCPCQNDALSGNEMFNIEWISDFADEINRSWKYYDQYFTKLCTEYDTSVEEKRKINSDNYFINCNLEVYHEDSKSFTHHQQRIFNQSNYKETLHGLDQKINNVKWIFRDQSGFLSGILQREKSDLDKVSKILHKFVPVIALLSGETPIEVPAAT